MTAGVPCFVRYNQELGSLIFVQVPGSRWEKAGGRLTSLVSRPNKLYGVCLDMLLNDFLSLGGAPSDEARVGLGFSHLESGNP